jgi:hypothetical protein
MTTVTFSRRLMRGVSRGVDGAARGRGGELQCGDRVLLEDLRTHCVVDRQTVEVAQPAFRGDQGEVAAEEDLVRQHAVDVLQQLRLEVLGRPAGQVDVDVRLVQGDGQALVLPGHRRVGHDDREVREVGGDVVEEHRVRVLQADPAAAPHPGADAGLTGVEDGRDAGLLDGRVERVEPHVVRVERLRRGVELEPLDPVLPHQPADRPEGDLVAPRVDAAERDEDVGVRGGELGDLFAGDRRAAGRALRVDGEDDAADVLLAVVGGDGVDRRLLPAAEQRRRRLLELPAGGVAPGAATPLGDVHVDVDGAAGGELLRGRTSG